MSYKIDFTKRQKLKNDELQEIQEKENKDKTNDILAPFDYYAYFGIDKAMSEEEENNYNNSDNNRNNNNNENINVNNNENNVINNDNKVNDIKIDSIKLIRKDSKYKTHNLYNLNNLNNINMMNLNFEPEIKKKNLIYNNSTNNIHDYNDDNLNKIKISEIKLINIKGKNKKQIKNNDNKVANDNINFNSINNEKNIKENNEQEKIFLGAEFNNNFINHNNNNNNLSQAYILMKKKTEEMQRMKSIYGGKTEIKYHQISTPPSLKKNLKHSRNNYNLNQFNILSSKDFKKGNIEDLYYSHLKREKLNNISYPPKLLLRSSSIDNINFNFINKKMLPKILGDNQKIFNSSINDKNSMYM